MLLPVSQALSSITFWSFFTILAAPILISAVDFVVLTRTRLVKKPLAVAGIPPSDDFTILVPIFGAICYLKNVEFLKQYSRHVVLCTTDRESSQFNQDIEAIATSCGFRIFRSPLVQSAASARPNPWRLFKHTLTSETVGQPGILRDTVRDEIIRNSFSVVASGYCIFIDGDTYVKQDLSVLVGQMMHKNYDLASVRVIASKTDTIIEKLQAIEYELAMDARLVYPWLTSGAGMVAKSAVIKDIMSHHSLFFSGGDIEIGKLACLLGYRVGHLDVEFFTDVPSTFKAWFKQRIAWCGGGFRHAVINMHSYSWRNPFFFFYNTVIVYLLIPFRFWEIIHTPQILPVIVLLYWIMVSLFHIRTWKPYYLLFPFYSLIQVLVIIPLGVLAYISMVRRSRNLGLIKLRFPHPLAGISLRQLHSTKLFLLLGSIILFFFFYSQFLTALLLFFRIPVGVYHLPAALVLTAMSACLLSVSIFSSHWWQFALTGLALFSFVFIAGLIAANHYYDISYDGNSYHQSAVIELVSGWDPDYRYVAASEVPGVNRWLNYYSKGEWYTEAVIAKFINSVEPAKSVNLLLIAAAFCLSLYALLQLPHLPRVWAIATALLLAFNPVSLYQSLSFYVDGQLFSLLICLVALLVMAFFSAKNYLFILIFICTAVLVNTKLTAVAYAGMFLIGGAVFYLLHEKLVHLEKLIVSAGLAYFIGIFVIGFSPYVTNTLTHGHPLYPAAGRGAIDFRTANMPQDYFAKNSLETLFLSAFSRSDTSRSNGEFSQMKSPLQITPVELRTFRFTDPIEGGWGPLFGLALIFVFVIYSIIALRARRHGFMSIGVLTSLIIIISCAVNPLSSVARYTPQFWLLPVITAVIAIMHRQPLVRISGIALLLVLFANIYFVGSVYFPYNAQVSGEWTTKLSALSQNSAPVIINPGEFRLSAISKFNAYHISYIVTDSTQNCDRIFSNSIVMRCLLTASR